MKKPRKDKYEPPRSRHYRLLLLKGLPDSAHRLRSPQGDERGRAALVTMFISRPNASIVSEATKVSRPEIRKSFPDIRCAAYQIFGLESVFVVRHP